MRKTAAAEAGHTYSRLTESVSSGAKSITLFGLAHVRMLRSEIRFFRNLIRVTRIRDAIHRHHSKSVFIGSMIIARAVRVRRWPCWVEALSVDLRKVAAAAVRGVHVFGNFELSEYVLIQLLERGLVLRLGRTI